MPVGYVRITAKHMPHWGFVQFQVYEVLSWHATGCTVLDPRDTSRLLPIHNTEYEVVTNPSAEALQLMEDLKKDILSKGSLKKTKNDTGTIF